MPSKRPMGVSQWRNHGKKWGYYDFWAKQERKKAIDECIKAIKALETEERVFCENLNMAKQKFEELKNE